MMINDGRIFSQLEIIMMNIHWIMVIIAIIIIIGKLSKHFMMTIVGQFAFIHIIIIATFFHWIGNENKLFSHFVFEC